MSLDNNYSDSQARKRRKVLAKDEVDRQALIGEYSKLAGSLAILDQLAWLDAQYEEAFSAATLAIGDDAKSAGYLQRAYAYDNMRLYIRDKLVEPS